MKTYIIDRKYKVKADNISSAIKITNLMKDSNKIKDDGRFVTEYRGYSIYKQGSNDYEIQKGYDVYEGFDSIEEAKRTIDHLRQRSDSIKDARVRMGEDDVSTIKRVVQEYGLKEIHGKKSGSGYWVEYTGPRDVLEKMIKKRIIPGYWTNQYLERIVDSVKGEPVFIKSLKEQLSTGDNQILMPGNASSYTKEDRNEIERICKEKGRKIKEFYSIGRGYSKLILDSIKDDDKEELSFLTEEERQAVDDYRKAIAKTTNPKLLDLYAHILKEEIEHIEELESQQIEDSTKYYYTLNKGIIRVYIDNELVGTFSSKEDAKDAGYDIDGKIKELRR